MPSQPPPSFTQATSPASPRASTAASSALTTSHFSVAGSSSAPQASTSAAPPSEAAQKDFERLQRVILDVHHEHTSLHRFIDPFASLPSRIKSVQESLYVKKGLLTTRRTELKRLDEDARLAHRVYRKLRPPMGTTLVLASRRRKWEAARVKWESLEVHRSNLYSEIEHRVAEVDGIEDQLAHWKLDIARKSDAEVDLDALDGRLFTGPTPSFPSEDTIESKDLILGATQRLLSAEAEREVRSRDKLTRAYPVFESVYETLKSALKVTLDAGVPQNQKYSKQILVNNGAVKISRQIVPILHTVKTESGKAHTLYSEARAAQRLIRPLPVLNILDLNRLPSKISGVDVGERMSDRAIHNSLETSYAQIRAQVTQVMREIEVSKRRSAFFRRKLDALKEEQKDVRALLRSKRRQIVLGVIEGRLTGPETAPVNASLAPPAFTSRAASPFEGEEREDAEGERGDEDEAEDQVATDLLPASTERAIDAETTGALREELEHEGADPSLLSQSLSRVLSLSLPSAASTPAQAPTNTTNSTSNSNPNSNSTSSLDPSRITAISTLFLRRIMHSAVAECDVFRGGGLSETSADMPQQTLSAVSSSGLVFASLGGESVEPTAPGMAERDERRVQTSMRETLPGYTA